MATLSDDTRDLIDRAYQEARVARRFNGVLANPELLTRLAESIEELLKAMAPVVRHLDAHDDELHGIPHCPIMPHVKVNVVLTVAECRAIRRASEMYTPIKRDR